MKGLEALDNSVRVHLDDRPASAWLEQATCLSTADLQRSSAYRRPDDRDSYLAGQVFLRTILGRYLGCRPQDVPLIAAPAGVKPRLSGDGALSFNLSRAGNYRLLALTRGREVGVDIETRHDARAERTLSALPCDLALDNQERDAFNRLTDEEAKDAFLNVWTRKEAVIKTTGLGLGRLPPSSFHVGCATALPPDASFQLAAPPVGVAGSWQLYVASLPATRATLAVALRGHPCAMPRLETSTLF